MPLVRVPILCITASKPPVTKAVHENDTSHFATLAAVANKLLDKPQRPNGESHHVCLSVVPKARFEVLAQFSIFPYHCQCNIAPSAGLVYQPFLNTLSRTAATRQGLTVVC
jgi:hypothetical protein